MADSSVGIWDSSTNLITNGGAETNITGFGSLNGTETLSRDTTQAKFGTASLKVVTTTATNQAAYQSVSGLTASSSGVASTWFKGTNGTTYTHWMSELGTGNTIVNWTNFTGTGAWQRITLPYTLSSTQTGLNYIVGRTSGTTVDTFWIDGMQVETGRSEATPYINTNGNSAVRPTATLQFPNSLISSSQGWLAMRMIFDTSSGSGGIPNGIRRMFEWGSPSGATGSGYISFYWGTSTNGTWSLEYGNTGTLNTNYQRLDYTGDSLPGSGASRTAIAYWTATQLGISVNGSAFTTVARGATPAPASTTGVLYLGNNAAGTRSINGRIKWMTSGTGTLTNADATTLNNLGNNDPSGSTLGATAAWNSYWSADNLTYYTP